MFYFLLFFDYLIPILMIISYPWWKRVANGNINNYSGVRTATTMKNKENWKRANMMCGRYCFFVGIFLFIVVTVIRYIKIFSMEFNSLIISGICIISMIVMIIFVNKKVK